VVTLSDIFQYWCHFLEDFKIMLRVIFNEG